MGIKVYRGFDGAADAFGAQTIIWFALDAVVAFGYANHRKNPTVREYTLDVKRTFDAGRSEQRIKVTEILNRARKQSNASPSAMPSAKAAYDKVRNEFGDSINDVHRYWFKSDSFVEYLTILGFDSISATEDGAETIGVFREFKRRIR